MSFSIPGDRFTITFHSDSKEDQHIVIDRFNHRIFVSSTPLHKEHATLTLQKRDFMGPMTLEAIFYDDIAEININNRATIHAKLSRALVDDRITVSSKTNIMLESTIT